MNKTQKKIREDIVADPKHILVQHIRGRRGHRVGTLVGVRHPTEDHFRIGWSKCNTKLDRFDRDLGVDMAIGRACKADGRFECGEGYLDGMIPLGIPDSMADEAGIFVGRCAAYFKPNGRGS